MVGGTEGQTAETNHGTGLALVADDASQSVAETGEGAVEESQPTTSSVRVLSQQEHAPASVSSLAALRVGMHKSSSAGGLPHTPMASIPSSPTAASEGSAGTTLASTSSAVPFSHIAQLRKQQEREDALQEASAAVFNDAAAAFDLRMQSFLLDISTLQELNEAAAQQYNSSAEFAAALGQFVSDLVARQAAAKEALAVLPQLDRQLEVLATAVSQLDKRSRALEVRLGVKPYSGSAGSSAAGSSSGAYSYLTSSVSQLTAVGVSTAAAGLGCLKGHGADSTQSS